MGKQIILWDATISRPRPLDGRNFVAVADPIHVSMRPLRPIERAGFARADSRGIPPALAIPPPNKLPLA